MRILELNTVSGIGSTGRIACDIAELIIESGGEARIAYGIEPCPDRCKDKSIRIGDNLTVKLHSAISQLFDAEGLGSHKASRELIELIEAYQPDILHMHNIHGCYLHYPSLFEYLKNTQLPTIWTLHDCWAFTGHCAYFDYVNCQKWQTECHHCPQSKEGYPRNLLLDMSRRNFNLKKHYTKGLNLYMSTPCKWMKDFLGKSFLQGYPCEVIYNGVDTSVFYPDNNLDINEKYNFADKKILLAVAGDWDRRKGIADMQAMADLLPDSHKIVAIGNNAPRHNNIISLARTESLAELRQLYSKADCILNPTHEDNFPMVNLEALACGTPVAVYNTGGCPEIIDDSVGAVLAKGDYTGLLNKAIELSYEKQSLTEPCQERARAFEKSKCYEGYIRLYESILKSQ